MIGLHVTRTALMLAAALSCCAAPGPQMPPAEAPKADAPQAAKPDPALELLERLEAAASELRNFQAEISYWKWDAVLEKQDLRQGQVIYEAQPGGARRFAILLDRLIIGNRKRDINKHYIFDGSWLIEIDHDEKLCIKRQVVPPGEHFDPLKLGEGPFPLPVGQPKQEVLARFEASALARPQDQKLAAALGDAPVEGLLLVPRPGTKEAKELQKAEIFYDPKLLLPVGICLTETNGNRKTVVLRNLRRNQGVDEKLLDFAEPDPKDWRIIVEPFHE